MKDNRREEEKRERRADLVFAHFQLKRQEDQEKKKATENRKHTQR